MVMIESPLKVRSKTNKGRARADARGDEMGKVFSLMGLAWISAVRRPAGRPGVLSPRHSRGRAVRTRDHIAVLSIAAIILIAASGVQSQPLENDDQPTLAAPRLDRSHARQAHRLVEQWVRAGAVDPEAAPIEVTGLLGVRVTIRLQGYRMGLGDAFRADLGRLDESRAVDVTALLMTAAQAALEGVRESMADARLRAVIYGREDRGQRQVRYSDFAGQLLVDVQLAHRQEPIRIAADDPPETVLGRWAPGYHGLRLPERAAGRAGGEPDPGAVMWPATAIALNVAPRSQLVQLVDQMGYDPEEWTRLGRSDALPLHRFDVFHFVRPQTDSVVLELIRGGQLLPAHRVDARTLDNMTDRLAIHLHGHFTTMLGSVNGTYHPSRDRYDPPLARDDEVALACYALTRYAAYHRALRPVDPYVADMANTALRQARHLARRLAEPEEDVDAPTAALLILAMVEGRSLEPRTDLRDALAARLLSWWQADRAASPEERTSDSVTLALVASALAAVYEQNRRDDLAAVLPELIEAAWSASEARPGVGTLPWLVLARTKAATLQTDAPDPQSTAGHRASRLADLVDLLMAQQVIEPPDFGPPDVVGGFVFTAGPPGSPPAPDWHTAQGLMFLALCLRDPAVSADRDTLGWLVTAQFAARLLGQLMIDVPNGYYIRNREVALGGMRMALWDNRLAPSVNAMGLLAVTELRLTTHAIQSDEPWSDDAADQPAER